MVYANSTDGVQIVGSITAYMPSGETPGLSVAQDVSHFHKSRLTSLRPVRQKRKSRRVRNEPRHRLCTPLSRSRAL